jgi:DNA-binding transcriptional MocR family regulator
MIMFVDVYHNSKIQLRLFLWIQCGLKCGGIRAATTRGALMATTKYQMLVDVLETAIVEKRLPQGAKLPSVRELMGMHCVSLATVTTALGILESRGLVEPKRRSGYFVKAASERQKGRRSRRNFDLKAGYHWWPDGDLFPRERLRKLNATLIRRYPDINIQSPRNNNPRLVNQLVARSAEVGCFVSGNDVLITHGITEALAVTLRCMASPGEKILLQHPVSQLYRAICQSLSLEIVPWDTRGDESIGFERLEAILHSEKGLRLALLACNFHCPTGGLMSLAVKQALLRMASGRALTIIEDDSSGDLNFGPARPLPLKALDNENCVIYISAATKAFAPGLQVGWIISTPQWSEQLEALKSISASAVDQLPQLVLAEFLAQGSHLPHLRKLCTALQERVTAFEQTLQPALGPIHGLQGCEGGFNRLLWAPEIVFDNDAEAGCIRRWPRLFSDATPVFRFLGDGISANLSFALDDDLKGDLNAFGRYAAECVSDGVWRSDMK